MGKASSNKKVARAAKAGAAGGLSRRASSTSWGYYGTLAGVVGAGLVLVITSLIGRPPASSLPPTLQDHWHAAYGVYDCDHYLPPINGASYPDVTGIHAHDDGLIHIHPFTTAVTGSRAVLGEFAETNQMKISRTEISYAGVKLKKGDKCKGKDGKDTTKTTVRYLSFAGADDKNPLVLTEKPEKIRLRQGLIIAMVRAPEGVEIPAPPSVAVLDKPSDVEGAATNEFGQDNSATTIPPGASSTAAPGASTTAVAGASTTAVAGASTTAVVAGASTTVAAGASTTAASTASTTAGASTTAAPAASTTASAAATTVGVTTTSPG